MHVLPWRIERGKQRRRLALQLTPVKADAVEGGQVPLPHPSREKEVALRVWKSLERKI